MSLKNATPLDLNSKVLPKNVRILFFGALSLACLLPWVTTPMALVTGLAFGFTLRCPAQSKVDKFTKLLLQASVVGLGFGVPIRQVLETGQEGLIVSIATISFAIVLGLVLSYLLKVKKNAAALISFGTAICGGSAIAAMAPVLEADSEDISVSMAAVFSLNALALFIFPWIGRVFTLTPEQFGLWSALAIHDTSSVVGAAATFGTKALAIGTTVKLSRALWILPIVLGLAAYRRASGKISIPWFVFLFIVAAGVRTLLPEGDKIFDGISLIAKQSLCVVLFWIGASINRTSLRNIGARPFILALALWFALGSVSLFFVTHH